MFANQTTGREIWSVSDLTGYIRELFEIDLPLAGCPSQAAKSPTLLSARSGHLYFTLKDDKSQLKCVMWRTSAERIRFQPQDGDAVVVNGRISVYEASGVYQLYCRTDVAAGAGGFGRRL
jgi:exodeoxyribonuclease VII large subunit